LTCLRKHFVETLELFDRSVHTRRLSMSFPKLEYFPVQHPCTADPAASPSTDGNLLEANKPSTRSLYSYISSADLKICKDNDRSL
jgi:hypothetical protein